MFVFFWFLFAVFGFGFGVVFGFGFGLVFGFGFVLSQGLSLNLELMDSASLMAASSRDPPVSASPVWGIQPFLCSAFDGVTRDPSFDPHTCTSGALPTEPFL